MLVRRPSWRRRSSAILLLLALIVALAPLDTLPTMAATRDGFEDTVVLRGLRVPTAMTFAPDGRVFVAEKSGIIKVFDGLTDRRASTLVDLRVQVMDYWDRGLMGMALDPGFPERPWLYVAYSHDAPPGGKAPTWGGPDGTGDACPDRPRSDSAGCVTTGRVSRFDVSGDRAGPEQVLLTGWCQQFPGHTIDSVVFGADGALYVSSGDGGNWLTADHGQLGVTPGKNTIDGCGDRVQRDITRHQGGALRAQDLRTPGDPTDFDGSVLRIDPDTGKALPDNPLAGGEDARAARIVGHGLRNPFRMAFRPGTNELWIADVGWEDIEEIDRILDPTAGPVPNFGWPCMEGSRRQPVFDSLDLRVCERLYAQEGSTVEPWYEYPHKKPVTDGPGCVEGGSSLSGLAFHPGGSYPARYAGALFFSDYSRRCIWAMLAGDDGVPDPDRVEPFIGAAASPVQLVIGPGGDLFYVDAEGGTIHRVTYRPGIGSVPLSQLEPRVEANAFGPVERDLSVGGPKRVDGVTMTVGLATFPRGIGVHAPSTLRYDIRGCTRFQAAVGVDGEVGAGGSVRFAVFADGERLYRGAVMRGGDPPRPIDLDITGRRSLRLRVTRADRGNANDHADWADARLVCPAGTTRLALQPAAMVQVGQEPHGVSAADMDGDGDLDLVVADAGSDSVSILSNRGDATWEPRQELAVGDKPKVAVPGDLDLDGQLDIVTADQDSSTVSVLLRTPDGSYGPAQAYPTCSRAHEVAVADLDADDRPDLAVACWGGVDVAVHLGLGDGTFRPPVMYHSGGAPHSVVARDLDGDGRLDLAVANHDSANISVLLGRGDGTFREAVTYRVGERPHSIRAGDLDEDGVLDLAVANDKSHDVSILLGRGDGTFRRSVEYPTGRVPKSVAIADLDNDGHLDVVVTNTGANGDGRSGLPDGDLVSVLLGRGDGTLTHGGRWFVGEAPYSVIAADLDADGRLDLATADFSGHDVAVLQANAGADGAPTLTEEPLVGSAPATRIDAPTTGTTWAVGERIDFSGGATDAEDGELPADALAWDLVLFHCPDACHEHPVQTLAGASGSFSAPDHGYPAYLEIRLRATDSDGNESVSAVRLDPRTVTLRIESEPAGMRVEVGETGGVAPFDHTFIVGSESAVSVASPQRIGDSRYDFDSWSDGGPQSHAITATDGMAPLIVRFRPAE